MKTLLKLLTTVRYQVRTRSIITGHDDHDMLYPRLCSTIKSARTHRDARDYAYRKMNIFDKESYIIDRWIGREVR